MSLVRDALTTLDAALEVLRRGPSLPAEPASMRALRTLTAQDAPPAKPPEAALAKLRRDLVALAREGRGYAAVPIREMRHAPWLLWTPEDPLAPLPGLLDELFARAAERKSLLRALIEAWIFGYAAAGVMIREVGERLRKLVAGHSHPAIMAWAHVDARTRLFDVPDGTRTLARVLMERDVKVSTILREFGFHDPMRATSGYLRATQGELLALAPDQLAGQRSTLMASRLFEFLASEGTLRFNEPQSAGQVARALLKPWLVGASGASEDARAAVQQFLVETLHDPRMKPQLWAAAGEEAIALVRRWLTKASLDAFFRLIRDHALDSHWTYREAFWGAYLKNGAIADAKLAFASAIYSDAQSIKELRGSFGRLEGNGVQPKQSVLLIRIGDLVFCEWSHDGSLRVWPVDWNTAPRLTHSTYNRHELLETCLPFPPNSQGRGGNAKGTGLRHDSSARGHWQGSVAELIARRAGVRLSQREYMPR